MSARWGVGAVSAARLERLGLRTIGDVADAPLDALERALGPGSARHLHELAHGRDPRSVTPDRAEKTIGHEVTFERDIADPAAIDRELLRLAERVAERLRRGGWVARTIAVKLRFGDFETITRAQTLAEPTDVAQRVAREARALYAASPAAGRGLRLIGVRASGLLPTGTVARGLWDDDEPWREAESTIDAVAQKFGRGTVRRASLLRDSAPRRGSVPEG